MTQTDEEFIEKSKTKNTKKKTILIIVGVVVGLCLLCLVIGLFLEGLEAVGLRATRTPESTSTITNTAIPTETATVTYTPGPTYTPEPTDTPEEILEANIRQVLGELNRDGDRIHEFEIKEFEIEGDNNEDVIFVVFSLNDNLTENMILRGGMIDIKKILEVVDFSNIDYSGVIVEGTFSMVDIYGNESEEEVIFASYEKEDIDKINWSNFITDNIFEIAFTFRLHPAFDN